MSRKMVFGRYDYAAFLTFASYAMCSIVIPMCLVPLARDLNFPLDQGGMGMGGAIQLGRSIPMTIMLVLCGFIGARWGNRISVGVAVLFMAAGILLASGSPGYWFLFAALTIAGLGEGVLEGLATPLVNDLHEEEAGRYINFTHSFWSIGVLATVLVSGALLYWGVSWRFLAAAFGCIALIPALLLLFPSRKNPFPENLAGGDAGKRDVHHRRGLPRRIPVCHVSGIRDHQLEAPPPERGKRTGQHAVFRRSRRPHGADRCPSRKKFFRRSQLAGNFQSRIQGIITGIMLTR